VNATSIFLRLQTVLGNFSSQLPGSPQSDGKTGGFALVPCGALFQGVQSIDVLTFAQTAFANVSDLNGLTSGPMVAVKGLLFYDLTPITKNNITINGTPSMPAGVMEAKQVHQFGAQD
jgi:hypothetical protein